jgi:hypothetical protein
MEPTPFSDVTPMQVEWLEQGYIPLQQVTLMAGEGGIGKSMLLADLAARITTGSPMPDGSQGPPLGSVILGATEDDPNRSTWWRLHAAGADMTKVYQAPDDLVIPDSLPKLREMIDEIGDVRMVTLDPLANVSSVALTSDVVTIRRKLLRPLDQVAFDSGCAIVPVGHVTKDGKIGGSKSLVDGVRMVLRVSRSVQNDRVRLIHVEKTNVASDSVPDLAYVITGDGPTSVHVQYVGLPDDVATAAHEPTTAERVLTVLRQSDKPLETQEVAREVNDSYGNVRVALTRLKGRQLVYQPERGSWSERKPEDLPPLEMHHN